MRVAGLADAQNHNAGSGRDTLDCHSSAVPVAEALAEMRAEAFCVAVDLPGAGSGFAEKHDCPAEAVLDLSGGDQVYIEDCPVCYRPIEFELRTDGTVWDLDVRGEND